MSSVIKAANVALASTPTTESSNGSVAPAATARTLLSLAPLQLVAVRRAERIVEQSREEARAIVETAQQDRESVLEQARREGYEAGLEEGRNAGREAVMVEAETRLQLLQAIVDELVTTREQVAARHELDIAELALAVAARIVRRESSLGADTVRELLGEILPRTAGTRHVTITLHPEDMEELEHELGELASLTDGRSHLSWATDERLHRGGCIVETERGGIDGTVRTRVARIVESLMDVIVGGG